MLFCVLVSAFNMQEVRGQCKPASHRALTTNFSQDSISVARTSVSAHVERISCRHEMKKTRSKQSCAWDGQQVVRNSSFLLGLKKLAWSKLEFDGSSAGATHVNLPMSSHPEPSKFLSFPLPTKPAVTRHRGLFEAQLQER